MKGLPDFSGTLVFGVGHSTRSLEELVDLLWSHGVATVADVRRLPGSRRYPHFDQAPLARALADAGVAYVHLPRLAGRRSRKRPDSPNGGWRNASFQRYADHMLSEEFAEGLGELRALAASGPVALLCSEAVPWRCHRSLIADALAARGADVRQIASPTRAPPHRVTPFARVHRGGL
ncbi:MAG: DUF488 family protein, partial [Myxococcales bacterium]